MSGPSVPAGHPVTARAPPLGSNKAVTTTTTLARIALPSGWLVRVGPSNKALDRGALWRASLKAAIGEACGGEKSFGLSPFINRVTAGRRPSSAWRALENDAWFWWSRVEPDEIAAVEASTGYGPHTPREDVLYIGDERTGSGIQHVMSAHDAKRAERHLKRFMHETRDAG